MSACGHIDLTIHADTGERVHPLPCALPLDHAREAHFYAETRFVRGDDGLQCILCRLWPDLCRCAA
jgi:hypothetical protein